MNFGNHRMGAVCLRPTRKTVPAICIVFLISWSGFLMLDSEAWNSYWHGCWNHVDSTAVPGAFNGYVSFPGSTPYNSSCHSCAYVTGSGHMTNSSLGREIDGHDCIIRPNDAPTRYYEEDVGSKTTMRTVDLRSLKFMKEKLKNSMDSFDDVLAEETFIVIHEYLERMDETKSLIKEFLRQWPRVQFFILTSAQFCSLRAVFRSKVAKLGQQIWISNGFTTLLFLHDICEEIHVYGMADAGYCQRLKDRVPGVKSKQYHYYDDTGFECNFFAMHARAWTWTHRFLREKNLFKQWSKEWGNLHFHNPEWPDD